MARFYKFNIFIFVLLISFSACQNEGYIGDFYGQWALKSSFVDGNSFEHNNLYLSFEGKVVWAKSVNAANHTYNDVIGRFTQSGDSLIMIFTKQNDVTLPEVLIEKQFGFKDYNNVRVAVSISAKDMQLRSGDNFWQFSKY